MLDLFLYWCSSCLIVYMLNFILQQWADVYRSALNNTLQVAIQLTWKK